MLYCTCLQAEVLSSAPWLEILSCCGWQVCFYMPSNSCFATCTSWCQGNKISITVGTSIWKAGSSEAADEAEPTSVDEAEPMSVDEAGPVYSRYIC